MYNIDAYYPCIKVQPSNPRSRKSRPCFPGYLFVNADLDIVGTSLLKRIPGVVGLVDFGSELASVPDDLVEAIRFYLEGIDDVKASPHAKSMPAQQVIIPSGRFPGLHAIFDGFMPEKERVRAMLKTLQDRELG
jgi:transcription antitermination factor NusG